MIPKIRHLWTRSPVTRIKESAKVYSRKISQAQILKEAVKGPLYTKLMSLRPQMAQAAQKVYDSWEGEDDEELGSGGICDEIAQEIAHVIVSKIAGVDIEDGGWDGDDHAWSIVSLGHERYGADIPPHVYEYGGGYHWTKRTNVHFSPHDVEIFET